MQTPTCFYLLFDRITFQPHEKHKGSETYWGGCDWRESKSQGGSKQHQPRAEGGAEYFRG